MWRYVTYAIYNSVRAETNMWFPHKELHIAEGKTGITYIQISFWIEVTIAVCLLVSLGIWDHCAG
jgi:hypothetical protein